MASGALSTGSHKFTATNGVTYHYVVSGSGPLVIFSTVGWGPSYHLYKNTMGKLEEECTVLYLEVRGIGESSRPSPKEMSTKDMASDLEYLRQHLGLEKLSIVGHSNGGAICLTYAEEFPERVEKLVLIDSEIQGFNSDNFKKWMEARKDDPVYGPALQALLGLVQKNPETEAEFAEALTKLLPYYFTDTTKAQQAIDALKDGSVSLFNRVNQTICDQELKFSAVEGLGKVKAQTLVLAGEEDPICSFESSQRATEGIRGAELKGFSKSGHFPWIEAPEEFFSALIPFLKS
ncbi:Alpha/Beta hydrolase protein [Xylogone sp. PMI_703]|nr:Alpha/Beta hydrolase protein [Xylogone sp. PMI_703]